MSGLVACFLDNGLPGDRKSRGFENWGKQDTVFRSEEERKRLDSVYNLPFWPVKWRRLGRYLKFLPPEVEEKMGNGTVTSLDE